MNVEHLQAVQRLVAGVLRNATTAVTDATYHGYEGGLKWRQDHRPRSSSGAPVDLRWTSVYWFRGGKICRAASAHQ